MPIDDEKARIFLSCGQDTNTNEVTIASQIEHRLDALGFETYVARKQQTLEGLKENIFARLENSEYFLFVDFKRERLPLSIRPRKEVSRRAEFRGSLFSHQELAIASYLGMQVLAYQERSAKREGVLGIVQANAIAFSDRSALAEQIASEVQLRVSSGEWDSRWRNTLTLKCPAVVSLPAYANLNGTNTRCHFFGLDVVNRHRSIDARNTLGYLDRIIDLNSGQEVEFQKGPELKWGGSILPNTRIAARRMRSLDAFFIQEVDPKPVSFQVHTDSTYHIPSIVGPGKWRLTYSVSSDTVPGTTKDFLLTHDGTLQGIDFRPINP